MNKTSTGLTESVAGGLCYLAGFVTGVIFLIIEKENKVVKFNALQSIITFVALGILSWVVSLVLGWIPFIGALITGLFGLATFAVWLYLIVMNFTGKNMTKLPVIGDICWEQANK